jgi:hypothetical protein
MGAQRLHGVLAAGRRETAVRAKQRADEALVPEDGHDKDPRGPCRHGRVPSIHFRRAHPWRSAPTCRRNSLPITRSRSAAISAWRAPAAAGWARSTSRQPLGSEARRSRISSRSRRFTRLRTTAEPTARLTIKPTFAGSPERTGPAGAAASAEPSEPAGSRRWPASTEPPARRPVRSTRRKSSARLILDCCGSTTPPAQRGPRACRPARPRRPAWSGAQLRAALTTACGKNSTASPGTHAQPEAMNLRPPTVVRLERTLAHWSSTSAIRDLLRIQWGQPVNGKGDTGTGQTDHRDLRLGPAERPGHCPTAPRQVYHRGTLRFPPHIPLGRPRLWKINVRTPVYGSPAAARVAKPRYGGHSARSVPGGTLASLVRPGHARHVTCTLCGLSCGQRAWSLIRLWQHGEARGAHR